MRNWLWVGLIALSLGAIGAGYFGGSRSAHAPPTAQLTVGRAHATPGTPKEPGFANAAVRDRFSRDDAVVGRPRFARADWQPERLSIMVGLCGQSLAVESGFLALGVPLTFDLDPHAAQATAFAAAVRQAGDRLDIHLERPPTASELRSLREQFGAFDGVASRHSQGMAQALAGRSLVFFDERGDADERSFEAEGVPIAQRDVTADDWTQPSYIGYMLRQAAERSAREGRVLILMRPMPESLAALTRFLHQRSADIVALR